MNGLATMAAVNTLRTMQLTLDRKPLKVIKKIDDAFHGPDYSAVKISLLEKAAGVNEVDTFFVDSSGWGTEREPALTIEKFKEKIKELLDKKAEDELYLCALTGIGQFQVYVTVFSKKIF